MELILNGAEESLGSSEYSDDYSEYEYEESTEYSEYYNSEEEDE